MNARIENPLITYPAARTALLRLRGCAAEAGLPEITRLVVEVRASQLNGCGVCLDMHTRELHAAGEPTTKIDTIAAWREVPYFTDAERAALALTEAATRLPDHPGAIPEQVWLHATEHYSEPQLAALSIAIATINAFNRLMVTTAQSGGDHLEQVIHDDHHPAPEPGGSRTHPKE